MTFQQNIDSLQSRPMRCYDQFCVVKNASGAEETFIKSVWISQPNLSTKDLKIWSPFGKSWFVDCATAQLCCLVFFVYYLFYIRITPYAGHKCWTIEHWSKISMVKYFDMHFALSKRAWRTCVVCLPVWSEYVKQNSCSWYSFCFTVFFSSNLLQTSCVLFWMTPSFHFVGLNMCNMISIL